ncbi:hypothetical protein L6E12_04320 [Actinokineospora sp. PR83]|uniref:DUF6745 domain-containing protein n=1 Tax=Actinokineospora sp. PR83 TaxID=2884908 RepID=UPI001F484DC0|nr:hypothetical protein [Actinokineospora sp. PR83]MCG8915013.1 hypothetical protein [Actinokineospora sp. PR83]
MSRRARRRPRAGGYRVSELVPRIEQVRREWLEYAFATEPADRSTAEAVISEFYATIGRPPPAFEWVGSPAAVRADIGSAAGDRVAVEFATRTARVRDRLERDLRPWGLPGDPGERTACPATAQSFVDNMVHGELRRVVREGVVAVVAAAAGRSAVRWYGQHDADWVGWHDACARLLGTRRSPRDEHFLALWTTLARSCGWWWPREGVCVVAERPESVHTEDWRLHRADGPALRYPDGWSVHAWRGTRVPAWVIEDPTAERISAEPNIEVRRCAIENIGWEAYLDDAGTTVVGRAPDPGNPGCELLLYDLPRWDRPSRLLLAVNGSVERDGTRRRYGLRVPPWLDDPVEAAAWSYGLTGPQYAQLLRRT